MVASRSKSAVRVLAISEIPTPYRLPLYREVAARPEVDLLVAFCAAEQPDRPWDLDAELADVPHVVLPGRSLPFRTPRGDTFVYELNSGVRRLIRESRPDALVIGGYAVLAEQTAIAIARLRRIPYLLHSESHLLKPRSALVRAAKRVVIPQIVGGAAAGLAVGSAAADYLAAYGLPPGRIRIFPNTIDVDGYRARAAAARADAAAVRARLGLPERFVLFAGRLVDVKGAGDLLEAMRLLGPAAPELVVAGEGPLADALAAEPKSHLLGFVQPDALVELFALADATVVPSRADSWGVTVNEALAAGSPVIASDAVGAGVDLVTDGVNGRVFPAGDVAALAAALAAPPLPRPDDGRIDRWTYAFAADQFVDALRLALPGRLA